MQTENLWRGKGSRPVSQLDLRAEAGTARILNSEPKAYIRKP